MQRVQRTILSTALLAGCALAGAANAQVIRITNVNGAAGHDIPLKANSSVQIDSAGNLLAECALTNGACAALSVGGPLPNAPTATLTRVDTDADLRVGETVRLAWNSSNADVCKASSTPTSGFSGPRINADGGGELVTLTAVGTYTYSLVCYNAAGASSAATVAVVVAENPTPTEPPVTPGLCVQDPQVNPTNFARVNKTWTQAFSHPDGRQATYPRNAGSPTPTGASKGTYVVIPFIPVPGQSANLYWDQVQPQLGYPKPRGATTMFLAISPCDGDLRSWSNTSQDKFLRTGCRKMATSASLIWSTGPLISETSNEACKLESGTTYFLHISPVDPSDGLQTGEHTCDNVPNSETGCDVAVNISIGPG